jgi:bifunctional enzyme CysN/CysC
MFTSSILRIDDMGVDTGRTYMLKIGTKTVTATVLPIKHQVDVNTGEHLAADCIRKNEILLCAISFAEKMTVKEAVEFDHHSQGLTPGRRLFLL